MASEAQLSRIMVVYWGRRGAMPRFALEFFKQATGILGSRIACSISKDNELIERFEEVGGRLVTVAPFGGSRGVLAALRGLLGLRRSLATELGQGGYSAVVELMPHVWSPLLAPVIRGAGCRHIVVVHDSLPHPGDPLSAMVRWANWVAWQSDIVVTLSRAVTSSLVSRGLAAGRIVTLFHPDMAVAGGDGPQPRWNGDRPLRLMFFGRIEAYKGLDLLAAAAELARARGARFELGVFGDGDIGAVRPRLDALGAAIVNRWLADSEIDAQFAAWDAVVLPYREASQSGVVSLALAAGMPSIVTPVGGLTEQVEHGVTGLVARAVTPEAIADEIVALAASPDLLGTLSREIVLRQPARSMHAFARKVLEISDSDVAPIAPGVLSPRRFASRVVRFLRRKIKDALSLARSAAQTGVAVARRSGFRLLTFVLLATLGHRRPRKDAVVRDILIFGDMGLGNFLMFTPALSALRRFYRDARITVLFLKPRGAEIVAKGNPDIDRIVIMADAPKRAGIGAFLRLVARARQEGLAPDMIVSRWNGNPFVSLLTLWLRPALRVGHITSAGFVGYCDGAFNVPVAMSVEAHEVERNLDLVRALGIEPHTTGMTMPIEDHDRAAALDLLATRGLRLGEVVCLQAGSSKLQAWKRWPVGHWRDLVVRLLGQGRKVVFVGSSDERSIATEICLGTPLEGQEDINLSGDLSVNETAALIEASAAVICNDSGLMHVAAAVGTPIVALFGPTEYDRTRPFAETCVVLRKPCACNHGTLFDKETLRKLAACDRPCLVKTGADEVIAHLDRLAPPAARAADDRKPAVARQRADR